jgi:hypothetical protein
MLRVCPKPLRWSTLFTELERFACTRPCTPPTPPKPLVLGGWNYSNDAEKQVRWSETLSWASANGCQYLVESLQEDDFYCVESPTTFTVGPLGGPMYLQWDFRPKPTLPSADRAELILRLRSHWNQIAGTELATITQPLALTGQKGRRLLVRANFDVLPPWGTWTSRASQPDARRSFRRFRAAVNETLSPHHVDHIDFTADA